MNLIQSLKEEGNEIILGGDLTDKMKMKEILRSFERQDKSTYIRGRTLIDKITYKVLIT
jgi:hypothetical protein